MMKNKVQSQLTMDILKETSRIVDFTKPVIETKMKLDFIKNDVKTMKSAKPYLEQIEEQWRNQLKFLYEAAAEAFPEDDVDPGHALSSLGPDGILERYDFKVVVSRK